MRTTLQEKLVASGFSGAVMVALSYIGAGGIISGYTGGSEIITSGALGFGATFGGLFIMEQLGM